MLCAPGCQVMISARGALGATAMIVATAWAFAPVAAPGANATGVRVAPADAYNPVLAGERLPDGFRQLLPRDGILPVYEPEFMTAGAVAWTAETQVIGVESGGEAKAYPVGFLSSREMVVDEIDGIPILVTW